MAQLLKDNKFLEYCKVLKVSGQSPGDPERRVIEKSFRKLALRTHPDKGGDPVEFRKINEAYKGLISHITKLEIIEEESKLSNESVIIEISKQALPTWVDKLTKCYGKPKTANVANVIFQGPYKQYKSASWQHKSTGPITIVVYEDPEDKVPKLHVRCDQYMIWIQQQKMPLHLHVGRDKQIAFDQWRIMSLAEFGFVSLTPGHTSARHDWKDANTPRTTKAKSKQQAEKEAKEAERRAKEAADLKAKEAAEQAKKDAEEAEELARKKKEDETNRPWWHKYGGSDWNMGETTPPPETEEAVPEDNFPKVFSMTSNSYTKRGLNKSMSNLSKSKSSLNSEEEENRPPAAKKEKEQSSDDLGDLNIEKDSKSAKMNESMPNLATNNISHDEMSKSENDLRTKDTSSSFGAKATSDEVIRNESNIPNDIIKETQVNGDVLKPPDENIPNVTKNDSEDLPSDDVEKKTEKEEISTKAKGARRDLGSVAEKLINKNKIKKIKSKRMGRAKSMPPTATQNEDNTTNEEVTCNDEKVQPNSEQENIKTNKSNIESEVPKMDEQEAPKESDNTEDKVSDTRKSSTTSRKRHLEASTDNLGENRSSTEDESKLEKESNSPSDGTSEPTAKSKSSSNGGETCNEASKPKVILEEFNNQTICSDSQEMDIADPILPSSCAQSAELSKDLTNDKEQSDMHVDSTAVNKEHINNKGDNECSIEQEKNNVLPENMEISSDSVEKEAVQEGQIKDNMSTNLKSEINPRKKHSKRSSNKECKEKISIAEEEPCQNNDETAIASGQQRPRENNSEMKTDRIKEDNERVTKAADIDDVMIENKNAYNLQHANTTCNDLKINQEAAKDILLQLEDVKKQRCKKAEIKKVDKENDNESKTNFPQNPNIESRTAKNEPIKINEKSQGQEKKGDDKDETEKIMNGHVKTDKTDDNKKDKVPDNLDINNASIRKTEEAHANPLPKTTSNSKPPQSISTDLPSVNINCLNGFEKDYDTNVIKEELMSLKEELKRQIVENRATNGDIDTNHSINGENCTNLDSPSKPKVDIKITEPEKPSDESVKSTSITKPKKKKIVKGKTNKSIKKEPTPGRELSSEILTESPLLTNINQIPETPKTPNAIPSKTKNHEASGSKIENLLKSSTELKEGQSETIIDQQSCDDIGKEINDKNSKVDDVSINNINFPVKKNETPILEQNHLKSDEVHDNLLPENPKPEKDTKEEPVPESSLKTEQTKFCEDLISQFIQSEVIQKETSLAKEIDSNTSSLLQKDSHRKDEKDQSEVITSQNDIERQKLNTISPQPIKVSNVVQQTDKDSGTTLQRPSAFHPRRNSTTNHGSSPKLARQGKSLDEEDSDHEADATNYKTTRSKSMATVDFSSLPNYNRVPARWQGVQINSFNQTPSKFGGVITEELEDKPVITNPPRKVYSPIKENIPAISGYNELIKSNLTSRQEDMNTKEPTRPNLGNLRHPLSRIEAETKETKESLYSPEQKEQRLTGISPATAYQQYTFARSKTSLHLNTYGGINQTNFSPANNDSDNYRNKTVSPPPKLETKQNSKIPDRFLKRMQHAGSSANEKLPPSGPSLAHSSGKSNVLTNSSQTEKYVPSPQESALSAKIKQAREEHSNACKDAKSFEKYERFNTVPTISTSSPQRSSAPRTLPSEMSNRLSQQESLNRTSRLSTPHSYNSPSSPNLSSNRHTSPLSSSSRARNMTLARSSSPFASGPLADRNARHAERLRIISDRPNIPSRFANTSASSGRR